MEEAERARSQEDGLRELFPCLTVQGDWQSSAEARGFINALLKRNKRKTFGLLEKPLFELHGRQLPVLFKKLFLVGKAGVGKTSTALKLAGRDIPDCHEETLGIQTTNIHWPVKLVSPRHTLVVKLEFWDCGERALTKFGHILPTCIKSTDGIAFFFSYADRHSWESLPQMITSVLGCPATPEKLNIVFGTHADCSHREVTDSEVDQFQLSTKISVLPISNVNSRRHYEDHSSPDGRVGLEEITPFMNGLTDVLLAYEQRQRLKDATLVENGYLTTRLQNPLDSILSNPSPNTESPSQ